MVEIAAAPANFAATPLYAAQLPDAEAVQAATVIPPPARPAQPLEDWAGPIRRDLRSVCERTCDRLGRSLAPSRGRLCSRTSDGRRGRSRFRPGRPGSRGRGKAQGRVFDPWGFDRCLWGTDWTRTFAVVNYEQAEPFFNRAAEEASCRSAYGRAISTVTRLDCSKSSLCGSGWRFLRVNIRSGQSPGVARPRRQLVWAGGRGCRP